MQKNGIRVFLRAGEAHVEGIDGTVELVWKAIQKRAIGAYFLSRKEIRFLQFAEDYLVKTIHAPRDQTQLRGKARVSSRAVSCLG